MFKHIGSNWTLVLLRMAVMIVLTPLMQHDEHGVGGSAYGVFLGIISLIGFIDLLALGVPMATVKHVAEGVATNDIERTNRAFSTSLGITGLMGVMALLVSVALYLPFVHGLDQLIDKDANLLGIFPDARMTFAIIAVHGSLAFAMRLPYALFDAHHEFTTKNLIAAAGLVLRVVLVIGLLAWRPTIVMLGVTVAACTLFEFIACMLVIRRKYPEIKPSLANFDRASARGIFNFSVFATLVSVGSMLAFRLDAVVIGALLTAQDVTAYGNGSVFFEPLIGLMLGIGAVVMPTATKLAAQGRKAELVPIIERWMRIGFSLQLLVCGYLIAFGPEFLGRWIAPEYEGWSGPLTQVLAASFIVFLPVRAVGLSALLGLGQARKPAIGLVVMGVANLLISIALAKPLGVLGVALGTAIPNVVYAAWLMRELCKELEIPIGRTLVELFARIPVGMLPPVILAFALEGYVDSSSWFLVLGAGVLWSVVFGLAWGLYVYRGDPHLDLFALIGRVRARFAGRNGS